MNEPSLRPPYAPIAVLLHWLIAALLVLQIVLADRMEGPTSPETFAVFQLHKSIGITILILSLARLGWRLAHPPAPAAGLAPWERRLSAVVHWGL
jgi:cytochrome b561